jgi:hypothetical protein
LRVLPSEIEVGAIAGYFGIAYFAGAKANDTAKLAAGDRVEAVVDVHPEDEASACLAVSAADRATYVFCAENRGRARLVRMGKQAAEVASGKILPGAFAPGARRHLSLDLGAERWRASIDGNVALEVAAPSSPVAWGVAAASGHSHYLGAHVGSIEK